MQSVSSNAVAGLFNSSIDNTKFAFSSTANTEVTAQHTGICYITFDQRNTGGTTIIENGKSLISDDNYMSMSGYLSSYRYFTILIRKGRRYSWIGTDGVIYRQQFIPFNIS